MPIILVLFRQEMEEGHRDPWKLPWPQNMQRITKRPCLHQDGRGRVNFEIVF